MAAADPASSGATKEWYIVDELPRGVGYGLRKDKEGKNPKTFVTEADARDSAYVGMSASGERPILLRSTVKRTPGVDPATIAVDDAIGRRTSVFTVSTGGATACQLIPHWIYCCPGGISALKRWLSQDPELVSQADIGELRKTMKASYNGCKLWQPNHPLLSPIDPHPSVRLPIYRNAMQRPPWNCPIAFHDYNIAPEIREQLERFQAAHPRDRLPIGILIVALLNYHYLHCIRRLPEEHFDPKAMKSIGKPPPLEPLAVFLIYFGVMLRRTTLLGLAAFPNSLRFVQACYECDTELYGPQMRIDTSSIDQAALMTLMDQARPTPAAYLLPADIYGSGVPPFKDLSECRLGVVWHESQDRTTALQETLEHIGDIRGFGFQDQSCGYIQRHRVLRHRDAYPPHEEHPPIMQIADEDLDMDQLAAQQSREGFKLHLPVKDHIVYIVGTQKAVFRGQEYEQEEQEQDTVEEEEYEKEKYEEEKEEKGITMVEETPKTTALAIEHSTDKADEDLKGDDKQALPSQGLSKDDLNNGLSSNRHLFPEIADVPLSELVLTEAQAYMVKTLAQGFFQGIATAHGLEFGRDYVYSAAGFPMLPLKDNDSVDGDDE